MTHRSPGFTEEDAQNGVRVKTKPASAIRHQQRREREARRHFESTVTTTVSVLAALRGGYQS